MADGSVTKRCTCVENGKRLGARCPKLRRGTGWNPHHGTWGYQLELPPSEDGRRRQLRRSGFDTREEAVAERDDARALLDLAGYDLFLARQVAEWLKSCKPGEPLPDRDMIARRIRAGVPVDLRTTVAEYLTQWLAERDIAPATRRSYRDHITNHLIPHLGGLLLKDLKTAHVQAMFIAIAARNNEIEQARASGDPAVRDTVKGVRPMGAASQQRLRATLRKALNDAISRHKLIEFNPAIPVELDSGASPKARLWTEAAVNRWRKTGVKPSKVMVWTPTQAGAFLDYVEAHDKVMYPFYALIMHRGLRRGEACGLYEHDVDLDAAMISVYEQTTSVGYQIERKSPKSEAGRRDSPLAKDTVAILTDYQQRKQVWRKICGTDWPNSPSFFVRPDGTPWHPEYATKRFDTLVKASGLPPVRLHDLRHCAATFMLAAGATLKEIQETLGHASYSITADIYTSVLGELQRSTADATAALIPRKLPPAA